MVVIHTYPLLLHFLELIRHMIWAWLTSDAHVAVAS